MMADKKRVQLLVSWKEQRRLIEVKCDDEIISVEHAIINTFELQLNNLHEYQIQYYDDCYRQFIDLYSGTLELFQKCLRQLLSSSPPPKHTEKWHLKIIPRTSEIMR